MCAKADSNMMLFTTHLRVSEEYQPCIPSGHGPLESAGNGALPGIHLIVDLDGAQNLCNAWLIETAMKAAINAAGATLLRIDFHTFGEGGGLTGVASLAESHISVHTWPENAYAALDIFMCGACDPLMALPSLLQVFKASRVTLRQIVRRAVTNLPIAGLGQS